MKGDKFAEGADLKELLQHIKFVGGLDHFSKILFGDTWKYDPKVWILQRLPMYLGRLGINNMQDIRYFKFPELLDAAIGLFEGLGDPFSRYLFLLVGGNEQYISDAFVRQFIQKALRYDAEDISCRTYLGDAVKRLKGDYPRLTVKSLYALICLYYSPDAFKPFISIPVPKPKRKADHSALFDDWD